MKRFFAPLICLLVASAASADGPPYKALIVDGQNNHNWKATTPVLKQILTDSKLFDVDVATAPAGDTAGFRPKFSDYKVVISNYNGKRWSKETEGAFAEYVEKGGGFVSVHAANNAFADWPEYNAIIGLGGWGGRNEKWGPYIRIRDGQFVRDESKGLGGSHGNRHAFLIETRKADHPITAGLPAKWLHATDELYDRLRGPAQNLTVLATAYADPKQRGSGEHEPQLMVVEYGQGRVFHTTLGHDLEAMKCVGFQVTLARGAEWAATGKVTLSVPDDFPTAEKVSTRP